MDALLGAMEPTIHRLSILPSVTARRKPHGGIFQGSSMYFFWGQVTHPSPARQCPAFPGEGAERSEVDEEWRYLADQQAGSIQMQHSFFLTDCISTNWFRRFSSASLWLPAGIVESLAGGVKESRGWH